MIDETAAIAAEGIVVIGGGLAPGSRDLPGARAMFMEGLAAVLPHARACGIPLALEPMHPMYAAARGCITTLREMLDIADALGNDGLGIAVDTYHVWWDPELSIQIARAGKRIIAHHICDWLVPTRHMLTDRGMMGDGVIDFPAIRRMLAAAGYRGVQEVEIFPTTGGAAGRRGAGDRRRAVQDGLSVARMERSVIRGDRSNLARLFPDYASLHPGYGLAALRDLGYSAAAGIAIGASCCSTTERSDRARTPIWRSRRRARWPPR